MFNNNRAKDKELIEKDELISELYKIIGQRNIELEWLKKTIIQGNQMKSKLLSWV